jgi:hypothetical protein
VVDPTDLLLVGLPPAQAPDMAASLPWDAGFCSLTTDAHEASAVLPLAAWQNVAARFPGARTAGPYRLITFDIVLDFGVVGFLAAVAGALAARGVSVYALSAYSRDHLLVRREEVEVARAALEDLIAAARRGEETA